MYHFLYLIQDHRDIGTNIYKIGKTTQLPDQRFKGYINGTYPEYISKVDDCHKRETELIQIFKQKYKLVRGHEYFSGNLNQMIEDFTTFCQKIREEKNDQKNMIINNITNNNTNNTTNNINITNNYVCELCNKEYDSKRSLDIHKNRKNKCNIPTPYQCKLCFRYFKQKKNLDEHTIKQICKEEIKEEQKITNNIDDEVELKIIINNKNISKDVKINMIHKLFKLNKEDLNDLLLDSFSNEEKIILIKKYIKRTII